MNRRNCLVFFAFSLLLGAGCSTVPSPEPGEGGFNLRGKMGVVRGEESFSARFLWQQQGQHLTMDLWGPLGQGRVQLSGNPRRLELREGDGTLISRGTPEAVMNRHLGWSLPLSALPQWVRGRPLRGVPVTGEAYDQAGHLTSFSQLGWQVELDRYRKVLHGSDAHEATGDDTGIAGSGPAGSAGEDPAAAGPGNHAVAPEQGVYLPYRVTARRQDYRVRLAVSQWQL